MAWTTPRTWVTSEVVTKALMDTHVRDNLQYLKDVITGTGTTQDVTLTGKIVAVAKSHQFGVNGGTSLIGALATTDANILLYNNSATNWAGFGTDSSGNLWARTGTSGTHEARWGIIASGEMYISVAGTASLPVISRLTDTNTGLYFSAADTLDVALGGVQAVQFGATGVLAAGTSASAGGFSFLNDSDTGLFRSSANVMALKVAGDTRFQIGDSTSLYGESAPYLTANGARIIIAVDSVVPLIVDRVVNDGTLISLRQGGTEEGSISVSGTTVAYNTFTGAHFTQLAQGQPEPPPGGVVITTGDIVQSDNVHWIEDVVEVVPGTEESEARGQSAARAQATRVRQVRHDTPGDSAWREVRGETKDYLPYTAGTTTPGDGRVYGVWMGKVRDDAAGGSFGKNGSPVYNVAGLGTFEVRVTDSGGDIAAGDLLETSARQYEAQRQADDVIRASTLGKALGTVTWDDVPIDRALGYRWRLCSVALYCG